MCGFLNSSFCVNSISKDSILVFKNLHNFLSTFNFFFFFCNIFFYAVKWKAVLWFIQSHVTEVLNTSWSKVIHVLCAILGWIISESTKQCINHLILLRLIGLAEVTIIAVALSYLTLPGWKPQGLLTKIKPQESWTENSKTAKEKLWKSWRTSARPVPFLQSVVFILWVIGSFISLLWVRLEERRTEGG